MSRPQPRARAVAVVVSAGLVLTGCSIGSTGNSELPQPDPLVPTLVVRTPQFAPDAAPTARIPGGAANEPFDPANDEQQPPDQLQQ